MLLSVVTLNYNTPTLTLDAISSVYKQFQKEFDTDKMEYIVIDNASTDNSIEVISKITRDVNYRNFHFIKNKKNVGFGNGCNIGAENAKGSYILFLNSDTKTLDKGFLVMAEFLCMHQNVAIIGGLMKNIDRTPQVSAWKFYTLGNLFLLLFGAERIGLLSENKRITSQVDWVTGGCMMVNKLIFDKIGRFDDQIFMYTEDMELCYRAKKSGYLTYFYPQVEVIHKAHGSSNRTFAIINIYKGIRYFYRKHQARWQYITANFLLELKALILVIIGKVTGNTYLTQTYEEAFRIY